MSNSYCYILPFIAYILGSIPSAVWIGTFFFNTDVREHGSGNAGATNAFRVLGPRAGIPVLIIDSLKGYLAVCLSSLCVSYFISDNSFVTFQIFLGLAALFGHLFPVFAKFKGGKGVATLLGVVIALHTPAALVTVIVFVLVLLASKYVSLSSIVAAFSFPLIVIFIFKVYLPSIIIFSLFITVLVVFTHRLNIKRLINKEESKVTFKLKQ